MRILIVKTSSMGDVIHTLPAITDAIKARPEIQFDWLVEEKFAAIPTWHSAIENVIPVAWRRWRKKLFTTETRQQWGSFRKILQETEYDLIIDAQGLIKSAFFASLAKGKRCGFDWRSARERLATLSYQASYAVPRHEHAVLRVRNLFAQALRYELPQGLPHYGIDKAQFVQSDKMVSPYLVFLHGTTWATKHWPEQYWTDLAQLAKSADLNVKLPWGTASERERAMRIASRHSHIELLPQLDLNGMARVLSQAKAVVAVDTGLGHLAAALDVPAISLYGPTNPGLTGALGRSQVHLNVTFPCSPCLSRVCTFEKSNDPTLMNIDPPCFSTLDPEMVWARLQVFL